MSRMSNRGKRSKTRRRWSEREPVRKGRHARGRRTGDRDLQHAITGLRLRLRQWPTLMPRVGRELGFARRTRQVHSDNISLSLSVSCWEHVSRRAPAGVRHGRRAERERRGLGVELDDVAEGERGVGGVDGVYLAGRFGARAAAGVYPGDGE